MKPAKDGHPFYPERKVAYGKEPCGNGDSPNHQQKNINYIFSLQRFINVAGYK